VLQGLAAGAVLLSSPPAAAAAEPPTPKAWVNFVINVQNFRYLSSSAEIVGKLCDLFSKAGVQGDFYLTGPMVQRYAQSHPEVIEKLKGQGICTHNRPPHPIFTGFEGRLRGLSGEALSSRINDFETRALDLATGELHPEEPGGFALIAALLGKAPSCVAVPTRDPAIKEAACRWYKEHGAKAVVWTHKAQDLGDSPFQLKHGLLARPSDITIYQWTARGEAKESLWWNRYRTGEPSTDGQPHDYIERQVESWKGTRPPFVTALIHENNFTRRGKDPWTYTFWMDAEKSVPRSPPFDLDASDPSRPRSEAEQGRILQAYARMIELCAKKYTVVTMADIAAMAGL